jgi:hypothetical protein
VDLQIGDSDTTKIQLAYQQIGIWTLEQKLEYQQIGDLDFNQV